MKFFGQLWCAYVFSHYVIRRDSVRYPLTSIYQKKRAEPAHLDFVNKKEKKIKKSRSSYLTRPADLVILPLPTGTDERPTADGSEGETGGRVLR